MTTAFPTFAQSFGQRVVPAATANIIYTTQPLWSALFGAAVTFERSLCASDRWLRAGGLEWQHALRSGSCELLATESACDP